jgi:sodium/proline symporter
MEIWMIVAFVAYFIVIIGVGMYFYNRSAKMNEYFLADRGLNPYVVALSAQASDMSGWLLMGLPGSILLAGVGEVWTGIGLAIGTYLAWLVVAKRLRVYSEKANNSITISEYFSNRFKDQATLLRILCGIIILVFFTVYVASAFVAGGNTLLAIFPEGEYKMLMLVGAVIVIIYTFLGGFKAVCWTDFFQGLLMLVAVIIIPLALTDQLGGVHEATEAIKAISGTDPKFSLDFISCGWIAIVSGLAWGLGYFGMPHIAVRYMSIKNPDEIRISRRVATVWVVISLACACMIGLIGRAWAASEGLIAADGTLIDGFNPELIFIKAVNTLWAVSVPALAGVLFAALMAAVMSTSDSQLLVASSAVSNDIYKHFKGKDVAEEKLVWISRAIIIVIAIVAALIALDPESSIMNLVSFAWGGFGAAFGPLMILSLFWKRTNGKGAVAGILTGFLTVVLWNTFFRSGIITKQFIMDTPVTGLYELLPGFVFAFIAIVVVSLLTGKPDEESDATFDAVDEECKKNGLKIGSGFVTLMGTLAAAIFAIGLGFAIVISGMDADAVTLSDLSVITGGTEVCAFIATFVGGFFLALFGYGLIKARNSQFAEFAGILLIGAGIGLMVMGFLDKSFAAHNIGQYVFIGLGVIAVIAMFYDDMMSRRTLTAGLTGIALLAFVGAYVTGISWTICVPAFVFAAVFIQALKYIGVPDAE